MAQQNTVVLATVAVHRQRNEAHARSLESGPVRLEADPIHEEYGQLATTPAISAAVIRELGDRLRAGLGPKTLHEFRIPIQLGTQARCDPAPVASNCDPGHMLLQLWLELEPARASRAIRSLLGVRS